MVNLYGMGSIKSLTFDPELKSTDYQVYYILYIFADQDGITYIKNKNISDGFGLTHYTISRAVSRLQKGGYIEKGRGYFKIQKTTRI